MIYNFLLLQEQAEGNGMMSILMIVVMFAIIYFMMVRPANKQRKAAQQFQNSLQSGDKVITAGGIVGKVRKVNEKTIELEVTNNVSITVARDRVGAYVDVENSEKK